MDILEITFENIEAKDNVAINKLVEQYCHNGLPQRSKVMFSSFLIRMFSKHYLNRNLWMLKEFSRLIANMEKSGKDKSSCMYAMKSICYLLAASDYKDGKSLIDVNVKMLSVYEKGVIDRMLYSIHKEYADLVDMKEHLHSDCYALLNVLYHNIANIQNVSECFQIIKYFIITKKKELLTDAYFSDTIDMLFVMIMKYVDNNRIPSDVEEFIVSCKDLFYYRVTQKDKLARINLFIYAVYILLQRKTKYQEITDYIPKDVVKEGNNKNTKSGVDYLYVLTYYDQDMVESVKNDRAVAKKSVRQVKSINVKEWIEERDASITIIRESYEH